MDRQRLAMAAVAVVASLYLLFSGRLTGFFSGQAARTVSPEPSGWFRLSGDVRFPGVYSIAVNNMTDSVMAMAEPLCHVDQLEQAVFIVSGADLQVVCSDSGRPAAVISKSMDAPERLVLNIPVELNRATAADLEVIPGIGPVMAQRIVQYRQKYGDFGRVEELLLIDGIGEKKLQQFRRHLQVTGIKDASFKR